MHLVVLLTFSFMYFQNVFMPFVVQIKSEVRGQFPSCPFSVQISLS